MSRDFVLQRLRETHLARGEADLKSLEILYFRRRKSDKFLMGMRHFRALLATISLFTGVGAGAGIAPKNSIGRLPIREETRIHVFKDHRSRIQYRGAYKIQTEEGKVPKLKLLSYDKNEMRVNRFKAWTVNGAERMDVPASMIQRSSASEDSGFSNYVNVEVAFPRMNVGSELHWEYEIEETQAPILGFFSHLYRLDSEFYSAKDFLFEVTSDLPLTTWSQDTQKALAIRSSPSKIEVRLRGDLAHNIFNETYGVLSPTTFPTIMISTAANWGTIGARVQKEYEARLREPLTGMLRQILVKVKKQKGFFNQVQELNRQLAQQIRYMGDWRGRHSGQIPRSLAAISGSQFGDCKDYSLLATRILRELGYEAYFASVYADRIPVPDIYYVHPNNYFNHQIVFVKSGKSEYWIDPTAQDDGRMVDDTLASRKALVWAKKPVLRRIPGYKDTDNGYNYRLVITPTEGPVFQGDLAIDSWGLESKFVRDEGQSENPLLRWMMVFFPDVKAKKQAFRPPVLRSDRPWSYQSRGLGTFENLFDRTPMGEGLRLGYSGFLRALLDVDAQWLSDFDFGFPSTRSYEVEFKERHFLMTGEESCRIESPWLKILLSVRNEGRSAYLSYQESFRTTEIPNRQLKTPEFARLQSEIKTCLASRVLILQDPAVPTPQRGLASTGMSIQLKRVAPPRGMAKYHSKRLTPMTNPVPRRVVADEPEHRVKAAPAKKTTGNAKPAGQKAAVKKSAPQKKVAAAASADVKSRDQKTPAAKGKNSKKTASTSAGPRKKPASETSPENGPRPKR